MLLRLLRLLLNRACKLLPSDGDRLVNGSDNLDGLADSRGGRGRRRYRHLNVERLTAMLTADLHYLGTFEYVIGIGSMQLNRLTRGCSHSGNAGRLDHRGRGLLRQLYDVGSLRKQHRASGGSASRGRGQRDHRARRHHLWRMRLLLLLWLLLNMLLLILNVERQGDGRGQPRNVQLYGNAAGRLLVLANLHRHATLQQILQADHIASSISTSVSTDDTSVVRHATGGCYHSATAAIAVVQIVNVLNW